MRINPLKTYLRHIVLLVKEHNEKITGEDKKEINRIHSLIHDGFGISIYEREFLQAIQDVKRKILDQINYFEGKIVDDFRIQDEIAFEVDPGKVKLVKEELTQKELDLLEMVLDLAIKQQKLEKESDKPNQEINIKELNKEMSNLMLAAQRVSFLLL